MIEKLQKNPLFNGFEEHEIERLINYTKPLTIGPNQEVVREGEKGKEMYIFVEGEAKVIRKVLLAQGVRSYTSKDKAFSVITPEKIGFFGEMSLITGMPRSATISTLTECKFLVMDRDSFYKLIDENPRIGLKLLLNIAKELCHRVENLNQKVLKLTTVLSIVIHHKKN